MTVVPRGVEPRLPAFHTGASIRFCQSTIFEDEEGFEPSACCLTNNCPAIELFIHCWFGEIRTPNLPGKNRKL
jgi:hypothetical protein